MELQESVTILGYLQKKQGNQNLIDQHILDAITDAQKFVEEMTGKIQYPDTILLPRGIARIYFPELTLPNPKRCKKWRKNQRKLRRIQRNEQKRLGLLAKKRLN